MRRKPSMITQEGCIADAVENAYSAISELQSEVQEVVDNASGTNRENTQRMQTLSDTADTLGNYTDAPEIPDCVGELRFTWTEHKQKRRGLSRSKQIDNASAMLRGAIDAANEREQQFTNDRDEDGATESQKAENQTLIDEITEFVRALEETADDIEGVEFPGWA